MREREQVESDVRCGLGHRIEFGEPVREQVVVAEHDPFRSSRGSRGPEDVGRLVGSNRLLPSQLLRGLGHRGGLFESRRDLEMLGAENGARLERFDRLGRLQFCPAGVDRGMDCTDRSAGQIENGPAERIGLGVDDAVLRLYAVGFEPGGQTIDIESKFAPSYRSYRAVLWNDPSDMVAGIVRRLA